MPNLYRYLSLCSIIITNITAGLFGLFTFQLYRSQKVALLGFILFILSSGMLYQSLMIRTELTSVFFALIGLCLLKVTEELNYRNIFAGFFFMLAFFTKIQIIIPLFGLLIFKSIELDKGQLLNHQSPLRSSLITITIINTFLALGLLFKFSYLVHQLFWIIITWFSLKNKLENKNTKRVLLCEEI